MATGSYVIEIDWDNNGTFTGSGENVTSRTLRAEFTRGRDISSQLTGRSIAGSLQLLINNQSGDYNSFNTSSTLNGSLLPGRLVQVRATSPSTGTLWRGYIERILPQPRIKDVDLVLIEAVGPLGFINQRQVSLAVLADVAAGSIVGSILDEAGWPSGTAYRSIATGNTTMRRFFVDRKYALDAIRAVEESEGGFTYESKDGRIIYEQRQGRMVSPYTTSTATFTDGSGDLVYTQIVQEDPLPFIFTDMVATILPFTTGATGTLWTFRDTGTLSPALAPSGTYHLWARYPNPTATANTAIGVDSWIVPTATVDYNVTTDQGGTGTNINADIAVTTRRYATEMRFTFNNTGTRFGYITSVQARGVPLLQQDPYLVNATSTSTIYGTRNYASPAKWLPNPTEAKDWADWNLSIYEDPIVRLQITYVANRNSSLLDQAIAREISDRVRVIATGTRNNLGLSRDMFIESQKHIIEQDRTHTVIYYLSDAVPFSDGWVMDTAALNTNTKLVY